MRRMISQELQAYIEKLVKEGIAKQLEGKDINVEGITSKGIANTGAFANIGDVVVSGDITAQGEEKGRLIGNQLVIPDAESIVDPNGDPIQFGGGTKLYRHIFKWTSSGSYASVTFISPVAESVSIKDISDKKVPGFWGYAGDNRYYDYLGLAIGVTTGTNIAVQYSSGMSSGGSMNTGYRTFDQPTTTMSEVVAL